MFQTIKNKAINAKTAAGALVLSAATAPAFADTGDSPASNGGRGLKPRCQLSQAHNTEIRPPAMAGVD